MWIDPKTLETALNNIQVRALRPNWSAPLLPTDEMVMAQGFARMSLVAPVYDHLMQSATELPPALINGVWTQQWKIETLARDDATLNLQAAIKAKGEEINAARLRANASSFTYQGKQIAVDTVSFYDILSTNGYVSMFGTFPAEWPGGWKTLDNSYLPIPTIDEWKAFYRAMYTQGAANFKQAQTLKARLAQVKTKAELDAIQWDAPQIT